MGIANLNHLALPQVVYLASAIRSVQSQSRFRTDVRAHEGTINVGLDGFLGIW